MNGRHKAVPASYLLVRRGDEILLMLRQNTGYYDGWYCIPSGHVEEGELPIDAAIRETMEEVGLAVTKADIRPVHTMYRTACDATGDRADYFFETTVWQGEPTNPEPHKCVRLEWFPLDALPENLIHHIRFAIDDIRKGLFYSELGADKVVKNPSA